MGLLKKGAEGSGVKAIQKALNRLADHWKFLWIQLQVDGDFGRRTERAAEQILFAMGLRGKHLRLALKGELTPWARKLILGKRRRTPFEVARSLKRRRKIRRWRRNYRKAQANGSRQIKHVISEVNRLIGLGLAYSFGGGHVTPAPRNGPYDCSSYASYLWQLLAPIATGTTYTLANEGEAGAGELITFFIKNIAGRPDESHVIVRIWDGHKFLWTQCGGRDNTRSGGGPCWFNPTAARIAEFNIQRHPAGY